VYLQMEKLASENFNLKLRVFYLVSVQLGATPLSPQLFSSVHPVPV